jgi:hypothetical protein
MRKIVITYQTKKGKSESWVCREDQFDHIMAVCEAKEFIVEEVSYVI